MAESTIITGQFVRISQTPASLGERMLALLIDYTFLFIYAVGLSLTLAYLNVHAFSGFSVFFFFLIIYYRLPYTSSCTKVSYHFIVIFIKCI